MAHRPPRAVRQERQDALAEQVAQIASSILEFAFNAPILVDTNACIIAGHGRLLAAQKLGMTEVPVVILDHLNETQRRAYIIADNRITLNGGWNEEVLAAELADLERDGFNLEVVGFSDDELQALLADVRDSGESGDEIEETLPEPPATPVTKPGDLWLIGPHRLICGDCRDQGVIRALFGDARANLVVTSPRMPRSANMTRKAASHRSIYYSIRSKGCFKIASKAFASY